MKKVILTKSNTKQSPCTLKVASPDNTKSKLAYAELFRAVLQIPEKDVQHRILDAVNGWSSTEQIVHALCPNCKQTFGNSINNRKEVAIQTDLNGSNPAINLITLESTQSEMNSNANSDDSRDRSSPALQKSIISSTMTPNTASAQVNSNQQHKTSEYQSQQLNMPNGPAGTLTVPLKRKRKRKVCLPQVVKRSHAQMAQAQLQPKLKSRKMEKLNNPDIDSIESDDLDVLSIFNRRDSIGTIASDFLLELLDMPIEHTSREDHIMRLMAEEYLNADKRTDGLLAIHRTIVANDLYALRRQIFVWKKLRQEEDLNGLLTDEDESCLKLAISQDCFPKIIDVLLKEDLNVNEIDNFSNTCVHLAILNEIELNSLRLLMQKIDLKLLLHLNDDGYTPLHLAVRTNSYLSAEIILNTLDERLRTKPLFVRDIRTASTEADFNKYYEEICRNLAQKYGNLTKNIQPKLKKAFLETGDRKSGNTALFFAIENKLEHFIFFLLAHLIDPRVSNFCGQDAKSYYSEFGKTLQLSLKVDSAMENVLTLLC
ncbi:PREDICTED: uncharacterized protein LOC108370105 [Rhagoletis zephyria]|uniref:uncharacterized protein LOC108370105 n=1 Tax=Rhagoletis zephyria TaxID=28612 RepID=UPI0008118BB2|nr:PREDICTED: uncharacterized protein LOC108370105 [Rhagoletis zephyria]XP_017480855.1 PREDICTED: uncharacterized protein LOC108370105 [Rhagoletis zephyria]